MRGRGKRQQRTQTLASLQQLTTLAEQMKMAVQQRDYETWYWTALELALLTGTLLVLAQEVTASRPLASAS